jgi:hypothetical protein
MHTSIRSAKEGYIIRQTILPILLLLKHVKQDFAAVVSRSGCMDE